MLVIDSYEWLVEVAIMNRHGTQSFGKLLTCYDGPGEHIQRVVEANQILVNIHYKN